MKTSRFDIRAAAAAVEVRYGSTGAFRTFGRCWEAAKCARLLLRSFRRRMYQLPKNPIQPESSFVATLSIAQFSASAAARRQCIQAAPRRRLLLQMLEAVLIPSAASGRWPINAWTILIGIGMRT